MPCWTRTTTKVKLSTVIKYPAIMADAVRALGGTVLLDGIKGPGFSAMIKGTSLFIKDGIAVTSPAGDLIDQFTQAYGMAAARRSALDEGWDFTQTGPGTFTAIKATEF